MRRAPATGYGSGEESACHWIRFWGGERLPLDMVLGRRAPPLDKVLGRRAPATG